MSSRKNNMSYSSEPLSNKKKSNNVKENQISKQTKDGLAYNRPPPAENTSSQKSHTTSATNMSYSWNN